MNKQLAVGKLHVQDVRGEGSCLFLVAAYTCYESEEQHVTLWAEVVSRIEQNKKLYKDIVFLGDAKLAGLLTNLRLLEHPPTN